MRPLMANSRTCSLLLDRGDAPSLAAALLQTDPSNLILWHVRGRDAAAARREAMVVRQAELFAARDLLVVGPWDATADAPGSDDEPALREAMEMLQAALAARRAGCARIVWPAQLGRLGDPVADAVDRATALADLVAVSPPAGAGRRRCDIAIDLPVVDLDDDQIVDILDDAGAPPDLFWPCDLGGGEPCGACAGCERWKAAFAVRGVPGPWDAASVTAG